MIDYPPIEGRVDECKIRDAYGRQQYTGTFRRFWLHIAAGCWIMVGMERVK